jgi:hypothetical protein
MRTVEENGGVGSNRHSAPGRKHSALSPCAAIPTIFTPREIDIKLPCKGSTQLRGIPFRAPWSAPETSKAKEVESDSQCGSRVWLFRSRAMSAIPAITAIRTPSPHGSTRIPKGLHNSIPGIPSFPNWQFWQSRRFWQSLFPPPRPFSLFYCKQSTYLQSTHGPRLGGPCVALGWRLGGPRVAQSQTQSQQAEGRNACQLPNTKNQVPRFLANCQLLAANCSVFKDLFPLTP